METKSLRIFVDRVYQYSRGYITIRNYSVLNVQGNIYSADFKKHFPPGFRSFSPEESFHEGESPVRYVHSDNALLTSFEIPPLDYRYKNGYRNLVASILKINKGHRGAILIMYKPRDTCIPKSGELFGKLSQISELKSKYLVTSTVSCPAYAFWLSDKMEYSPIRKLGSISRQKSDEDHGVSVIMTSKDGKPHWWQYPENIGTLQSDIGNEDLEGYAFTPYYSLKQIIPEDRPLRRSAPSPERKGTELWIAGNVPWAPLDEDGEEIEVHDDELDEAQDEQT